MKKIVSRSLTAASVVTVAAVLGALGIGVANAATTAAAHAASEKAMVAAAPAYLGATSYADTLDTLAADSVEAKKVADAAAAEAARVAAEQEAARVAAEQQAAAAAEAQRVAAAQEAAAQSDEPSNPSDADPAAPSGPSLCPAGMTAGAVDDAGNESNCTANGPTGTQCVAYDDANNCTQWYKP